MFNPCPWTFRPTIRLLDRLGSRFRAKADLPVGFPYRFNSSFCLRLGIILGIYFLLCGRENSSHALPHLHITCTCINTGSYFLCHRRCLYDFSICWVYKNQFWRIFISSGPLKPYQIVSYLRTVINSVDRLDRKYYLDHNVTCSVWCHFCGHLRGSPGLPGLNSKW